MASDLLIRSASPALGPAQAISWYAAGLSSGRRGSTLVLLAIYAGLAERSPDGEI